MTHFVYDRKENFSLLTSYQLQNNRRRIKLSRALRQFEFWGPFAVFLIVCILDPMWVSLTNNKETKHGMNTICFQTTRKFSTYLCTNSYILQAHSEYLYETSGRASIIMDWPIILDFEGSEERIILTMMFFLFCEHFWRPHRVHAIEKFHSDKKFGLLLYLLLGALFEILFCFRFMGQKLFWRSPIKKCGTRWPSPTSLNG